MKIIHKYVQFTDHPCSYTDRDPNRRTKTPQGPFLRPKFDAPTYPPTQHTQFTIFISQHSHTKQW